MRNKWLDGLLALALGGLASAGALSFPPYMPSPPSEKPHPAIEKLRAYSATLYTNLGAMEIAFEPDQAPNAVRNFIKLSLKGFYDGSRFYCVFKDKMILAGDPTDKGAGNVGYTLDHERTASPHDAGTLAMDTVPKDPNDEFALTKNSGSRFFINVADQRHLDRDYTVFAHITKGLPVAERISRVRTRPNNGSPAPIEDIVIERITITKKEEKKEKPLRKPGSEEKK